jgi:endonuclease/exonuclease/phosphatase family metal-dependent hydrolase
MRGRLLKVALVLMALLGAVACGDDSTSDTSATGEGLAIVTYNAGLAEGFVDLAAERAPLVNEAIADLAADVVFVQEVWSPADVEGLTTAVADRFPDSFFLDPMPDEPGQEETGPACPLDESQALEDCARARCADVPADQLASCVLEGCSAEFSNTCPECQACLAANVGSSIDEAITACTEGSGSYAYEGAFGIGFLSSLPVLEQDSLVLESSLNRRAVLHVRVEHPELGPLNLFGTHLSAVFSDIPFPGEGSWEAEQAAQIESVRSWIDEKTGGEGTTILLGDFNTGPEGVEFVGEVEENYQALVADGWVNTYLEAQGDEAECTYCDANPLVGGEGDSGVLLDHVLVLGHGGEFDGERIFDDDIELEVDGVATTTALSDHFGVLVTLAPR